MITEICNRLALLPECTQTMLAAYEQIKSTAPQALAEGCRQLMDGNDELCREQVAQMVRQSGVCQATAIGVMLLEAVPLLSEVYEQKGIDQAIMWDTLVDLRCKFNENHDTGAPWGTGALIWYYRIYRAAILKLGRLEFEPIGYKWDIPFRDIQKGDPVMNIHIPSTGPMTMEEVLDSFRQAYRFFGYTQPMPVVAASWLLYPPMCEAVFTPGSNLMQFYRLFEQVDSYEKPDNPDFWRIFHMDWEEGVLDRVPLDTSLRRNLHAFMKTGRNMGMGRCALLFDGEKIIS